MIGAIQFEYARAWFWGLPLIALWLWRWRREAQLGIPAARRLLLGSLRAAVLLLLVFLAARPVWISRLPEAAAGRSLMLLVDRSESMSLEEDGQTRYQRAYDFVRQQLLPGFKAAGVPMHAMLFAEDAERTDGQKLSSAIPNGRRTNLGNAIAAVFGRMGETPLAVLALTDGNANENADDRQALSALLDSGVPFIGVGIGKDQGTRTLNLRDVAAPATVASKTSFSLSAQLEMMNTEDLPPFELLLFRDNQLHQRKTVTAGKNSRLWLESFQLIEEKEGVHQYRVQLLSPGSREIKTVNAVATATVRISDEKELRVLYIQGALTWDYKFIHTALRSDQTMKLTGLTRTSKQSVFRQNVETAGELLNGFPTALEELAPFRVVVLSNLRPTDLTPAQQEVLARFCGELGGGVLLIGGPGTFESSWQGSRLEQLLPVVFAAGSGVEGLDRPFRLQLTEEALLHPVFQIGESRPNRELWGQLPTFSQYGRVDAAKPGAQVWMTHPIDEGPRGRRILMASQRYGAGISAVMCIQNLWRWRLARDSDPAQFDRFWRQLFRFLGEVGRQDVSIHVADQELRPQMDIRLTVEKQPNPKDLTPASRKFFVRIEDGQKALLREETVDLEPLRPVELTFHAAHADVYQVHVLDASRGPVASQEIEIRDVNVEFQNTARNMETLRQWAEASDGLAVKLEDCRDAGSLASQIKIKIEQARRGKQARRPLGLNGWALALTLGCLAGEWVARKKWGLI
jgi:hypothetical protein